jgi:hypothetical protein
VASDAASIWHRDETPGYDKGKKDVGFTRWRVLIMERLAEKTEAGQDDAVSRIHSYGLRDLGLDYEKGVTAEDLATKLAKNKYRVK